MPCTTFAAPAATGTPYWLLFLPDRLFANALGAGSTPWWHLNESLGRVDCLAADPVVTNSFVYVYSPNIFEQRGTDSGKCNNGHKRQITPDVRGGIFACNAHAANGHDSTAGCHTGSATAMPQLVTTLSYRAHRQRLPRPIYHPPVVNKPVPEAGHPLTVGTFVAVVKRWAALLS